MEKSNVIFRFAGWNWVAIAVVLMACLVNSKVAAQSRPVEAVVSIIKLIAVPEAYPGKQIVTRGFFIIDETAPALYVSRTDAEYRITKNALRINLSESQRADFRRHDRKYASIEGVYGNADPADPYSGAVGSVERIFMVQAPGQDLFGEEKR